VELANKSLDYRPPRKPKPEPEPKTDSCTGQGNNERQDHRHDDDQASHQWSSRSKKIKAIKKNRNERTSSGKILKA